jgi:hypothetical protein
VPTDLKHGQLTTWPVISEFVFGGNAVFTLRSLKTGMRYTYRVRVKKQDVQAGLQGADLTYFVDTLRGPDNTKDFRYLGVLHKPGTVWRTQASQQTRVSASLKALVWFTGHLREEHTEVLGKLVEFWHAGRCGCCGRALMVPESVVRGLGPECAGKGTK